MKEIVLEMNGIEKSFPGVKALNGANLTLYKGRVMGFLGENGAGKSTMMKVMTGIYSKDAGTLKYLGEEREFKGVKDSQKLGIAIIHQELNLIPQLTVMENIFLGREHSNGFGQISWKEMYDEAKKYLEILGMDIDPKEKVENLSIGVQQMIEIAKVLSQNAQVIVMDEPTDALTDKETEYLFKVIKQLASEGRSIVYISHRLKEIPIVCDDITIMRDGKFICEREVVEIDEDFIVKNMVGRSLDEQFPRVKVDAGEVVLKVENLKGEKVANVSFELKAGEILGVAGLMGAGRTELAKTIYGYYKKTEGAVYVNGLETNIKTPEDGLKAGIAYVSEDRKGDGLVLGMSVKENMTLSALKSIFSSFSINKKEEASKVDEYIGKFNVKTPTMDQKIKNLSGGNQQKVAIAKALLTNPKILILDEPTRGVDVGAKKEIYDVINELKTKGLSIIMISSEMPEVLGLSDKIMVMHENHVTGIMPIEDATQEKIMRCAVGVN